MATITIGRNPQNTIVVDATYNTVSSNHATITDNGGTLTLQDHSTNGTYINGQYIHNQSATIRQGDRITLGTHYELSWREIMQYFGGSHATQRIPNTPQTERDNRDYNAKVKSEESEKFTTKPDNYLGWSSISLIVSSIVFFILLGIGSFLFIFALVAMISSIIAVIKSAQVNQLWRNKNKSSAYEASAKAKSMATLAIVMTVICIALFVIALIIVFG